MTLSAKNAQDGNADVWTYTFEHLPDTDGSGNPYTYWVEEEHLESYTVTGSGTLALTNTLGGKETEIPIQGRKTWVGDGADDRPNSITLSLLQNGTKVAEREVTPNADGSWTYDFGSWPAYDDSGRAYTYTVQEEPVDGYGSRVDGWNVINGKGNLTVKKQVYSGDRQRDFSFTVTLDDKSINGICGKTGIARQPRACPPASATQWQRRVWTAMGPASRGTTPGWSRSETRRKC